MNTKDIAKTLRDKLKKYEAFKGLYVFGSRVTGNYTEHSDLDVIAVFEEEPEYEKSLEISGEVNEVEADLDIFIDFHSMTEKELNLNTVFFNEVKKGWFYAT